MQGHLLRVAFTLDVTMSSSSLLSLPPGTNARGLLILAVGLLALFVPTYRDLAAGVWVEDVHSHGPMILGVCLWLLWYDRAKIFASEVKPSPVLGGVVLLLGLALHFFGRSQSIIMLEAAAQPLLFSACLLLVHGRAALKAAWFPIFFMLFMIPWPEVMVQAITMPLKHAVSVVTEIVLFHTGYPIGRSGVTLSIGPYRLLVADACSGMNSLLTLESLGLLYMRIMNYRDVRRNTLLALAIIPTSFVANVLRVVVLVLVTYYYGDEVGQGFVHNFSGLMLFVVSLVSIYGIDQLLGFFFDGARREPAVPAGVQEGQA
ncbi:MAG: exosortase [Pseudomonadota bacterium]|jgi:exosortase B